MENTENSIVQKLVLFYAGLFNPLLGFAIYFIIKDDEKKKHMAEFIQRGSIFGVAFIIIGLIIYSIFLIII